jgi:hydrogenase maturation protease
MNSVATDASAIRRSLRALVIGYGSPIRGDDAIGPIVADRLDTDDLSPEVRVISRHILTADLVPDICAAQRVIFIDAAANGTPGEIRCRRLEPDANAHSSMAHFLGPRELLAWAAALYDTRPDAYLITVAGDLFDFSHFDLSEAVDQVLPELVRQVEGLIAGVPLPSIVAS